MTMEQQDGLEILSQWRGTDLGSSYVQLLGFSLVEVSRGSVLVSGVVRTEHNNTMGRTHGGFCASLLDTAMGCAVMSMLNPYQPYGTVELNIHFVRKIDVESGTLSCRASVLHSGRTMLTTEAKVHNSAGKLCAHGTGTFLVYPK
jgi:acyl-CoA thioesterase